MSSVPQQDGMHRFVDEEDYHGDRGSLSVSGAKLLLPPSCPAKFRWEQDNTRKPKKVWDFGHVAHKLVLGKGAEFEILDPDIHGLKADGTPSEKPTATANWRKAEADARKRGKVPIHVDLFTKAYDMAEKVRQHPTAGPIFADPAGVAEVALYYTDPETGVRLRGRCDWLTHVDGRLIIVDYKTSVTANPAELVRKFWALGYHLQASWYRSLAMALGLDDDPDFLFVVSEKDQPHVVTMLRYDSEALAEGERLNRRAIDLYAECQSTGTWPTYTDRIVPLSVPGWALSGSVQSEADDLIAELEALQ
ncbi:RecB-like exonuclease/helicase [Mycobacterium phage Xavia]|uniref:RecB-like exonuclease/helicase n=1 Tax=Mycobacterium phage Xavia TaxID=2178923 RepID=A0A2U8UHI2_9CAUD|nr:exonuclease VIII [Mycobacterium phage Xavia]AWN02653.1 RecB-like exonuclease/helicase [Mycobacterium phage Xavia]